MQQIGQHGWKEFLFGVQPIYMYQLYPKLQKKILQTYEVQEFRFKGGSGSTKSTPGSG